MVVGPVGESAGGLSGRTCPAAPVEADYVTRDRVRDCDSSAWLAGLRFLKD
jgi:hypothetical protein